MLISIQNDVGRSADHPSSKEKVRFNLQFFLYRGENVGQATENVTNVHGLDIVTVSLAQS